jgi:DoxX-like family
MAIWARNVLPGQKDSSRIRSGTPLRASPYAIVFVVADEPGIYVEILIRASVDEIWRHTQVPDLHQLWDLRFTTIEYLPRPSEAEPQKFLYSTRIGFGLRINGNGESTGTREDATGVRTSALSFSSSDPKSLIREGSGYWQYHPTAAGVRFLTWYDYRTRFGQIGRLFDRVLFRPLIGWATAWSFDRLRLWVDRGVPPELSMRMASIHAVARLGIAFTWMWQGLIPKLIFPSLDERAMIAAAGLRLSLLPVIGVAELAFAAATLLCWRWRSFFVANSVVMAGALIAVSLRSPSYLVAAFNPVTLNLGVILLSIVGYLSAADLPSASRCLRHPLKRTS